MGSACSWFAHLSMRKVYAQGFRPNLRCETVLLHFSPESHRTDVQRFCRPAPVAVEPLERLSDQTLFVRLQVEGVAELGARPALRKFRRQLADGDARAARQNDRAFNRMFQLPHVSRP